MLLASLLLLSLFLSQAHATMTYPTGIVAVMNITLNNAQTGAIAAGNAIPRRAYG
jgi:hypothetical protein